MTNHHFAEGDVVRDVVTINHAFVAPGVEDA